MTTHRDRPLNERRARHTKENDMANPVEQCPECGTVKPIGGTCPNSLCPSKKR